MSIAALHQDPELWPNPTNFDPDRFLKPITPGSFLPFGDGPHNCIGFKLALIEVKIFLLEMLNAFSMIELVPGQEPIDSITTITRKPRKSVKISLTLNKG